MRLDSAERRVLENLESGCVSGAFVRSIDDWKEILADMDTIDAAARIFGDILCFQPDRGSKRRHGALEDVVQLSRALRAWRELPIGKSKKPKNILDKNRITTWPKVVRTIFGIMSTKLVGSAQGVTPREFYTYHMTEAHKAEWQSQTIGVELARMARSGIIRSRKSGTSRAPYYFFPALSDIDPGT